MMYRLFVKIRKITTSSITNETQTKCFYSPILRFNDAKLRYKSNDVQVIQIYRKPTFSGIYTHFESFSPST